MEKYSKLDLGVEQYKSLTSSINKILIKRKFLSPLQTFSEIWYIKISSVCNRISKDFSGMALNGSKSRE